MKYFKNVHNLGNERVQNAFIHALFAAVFACLNWQSYWGTSTTQKIGGYIIKFVKLIHQNSFGLRVAWINELNAIGGQDCKRKKELCLSNQWCGLGWSRKEISLRIGLSLASHKHSFALSSVHSIMLSIHKNRWRPSFPLCLLLLSLSLHFHAFSYVRNESSSWFVFFWIKTRSIIQT